MSRESSVHLTRSRQPPRTCSNPRDPPRRAAAESIRFAPQTDKQQQHRFHADSPINRNLLIVNGHSRHQHHAASAREEDRPPRVATAATTSAWPGHRKSDPYRDDDPLENLIDRLSEMPGSYRTRRTRATQVFHDLTKIPTLIRTRQISRDPLSFSLQPTPMM